MFDMFCTVARVIQYFFGFYFLDFSLYGISSIKGPSGLNGDPGLFLYAFVRQVVPLSCFPVD